jgi:hypothetical protein
LQEIKASSILSYPVYGVITVFFFDIQDMKDSLSPIGDELLKLENEKADQLRLQQVKLTLPVFA